MATATFSEEETDHLVNLPDSSVAPSTLSAKTKTITINVHADGSYLVNNPVSGRRDTMALASMREELANMASGQSWVDFNDGRSTEEHGTPPIPRRAGSDAQPASFKPKRSPLVPEAAPAAAGEKAAEEKAGEKAKAPLNKLPVRTNPVSYKPAEERKASLSRQKTASEWMAEQTYKFISLADFQKKWTGEAQPGDVISKQDAKASEMHAASHAAPHVADATGPSDADMDEYVGVWRAAGLENRDEFLKAMALPWILRQIAKALPQPDNTFFRDDEGHLHSHSTTLGKTTED